MILETEMNHSARQIFAAERLINKTYNTNTHFTHIETHT